MASPWPKLEAWLNQRLLLAALQKKAAEKTVPEHRYMAFYYFGGMTLFFFAVQVLTGILLMLYYRPSADTAFESIEFLMTTVPFGWLIRSLHSWSANLMVFTVFAHLTTVFFLKAYRPPRELTWISGCLILFLTLAFGFSGYLLPWNQLAFFATKVGTDIAGAVPVVGSGRCASCAAASGSREAPCLVSTAGTWRSCPPSPRCCWGPTCCSSRCMA